MTLELRRIHRGIGLVLDDTQRDMGVNVTALVQRAVYECTDACRCCELSGNTLALPVYILVEIHQKIYMVLQNTPMSLSLCVRCSCM
jgi:hypothetical protein